MRRTAAAAAAGGPAWPRWPPPSRWISIAPVVSLGMPRHVTAHSLWNCPVGKQPPGSLQKHHPTPFTHTSAGARRLHATFGALRGGARGRGRRRVAERPRQSRRRGGPLPRRRLRARLLQAGEPCSYSIRGDGALQVCLVSLLAAALRESSPELQPCQQDWFWHVPPLLRAD